MTRTLFEGGRNGDETARVRRLKLVRLAESMPDTISSHGILLTPLPRNATRIISGSTELY